MADDDGNKGGDTPPQPTQQVPEPPKPKTFEQEEVNRIAAREKNEGKQAAMNEVSEKLGVSLDEAAEILRQHREASEAQKTEAQRERDAAEQEKQAAKREREETAAERHRTRLERALIRSGAPVDDQEALDDLVRMIDVQRDVSDDVLQAEIARRKEKFPSMFTASTGPRAPNGDPGGTPPPAQGTSGADALERGAQRAKKMLGRT